MGAALANRATLQDVAREAGVSVATVDRAINGRSKVRPETLQKIAEAAHRVGYHGTGLFQHRLAGDAPRLRMGFLLLKQSQDFYRNFEREILKAVAERSDVRGTAEIRYSSSQSPSEFAALLQDLGTRCDAIAAVAVNDRQLDEVVRDLKGQGVPVFALLNDFAQGIRRSYIGLNNVKVGRLAAWMLTTAAPEPGKLAIFVGGNRWHGHDLREAGFRSFVREHDAGFSVLDTVVNLETREVTYEATLDLLHRHPDLRGLYVAGGGMEGAIAALREAGASPRVSLVVNELTEQSRSALIDGVATMAIVTPLAEVCREVVGRMAVTLSDTGAGGAEQQFLPPKILLPEAI